VIERPAGKAAAAAIPASAITQSKGEPAVWIVRRTGSEGDATVDLVAVTIHDYRTDEVLISGPAAGELVVTAGVQKMAPGLRVALGDAVPGPARETPRDSAPSVGSVKPSRELQASR
jgi:hypothetical protein